MFAKRAGEPDLLGNSCVPVKIIERRPGHSEMRLDVGTKSGTPIKGASIKPTAKTCRGHQIHIPQPRFHRAAVHLRCRILSSNPAYVVLLETLQPHSLWKARRRHIHLRRSVSLETVVYATELD